MGFACPKGWLNISRKTYSSSACFFFLIFLCELYTCCGGLTRNQMGLSYFSMERFPTFLVSEHQSFGWLLVSTMSWIDYVLVYMPYICIYIHCMYMPRSMSAVWLEIVPILFGSMYFFFMGERWRWMNIDCIFADPSTCLERPPIGRDNTYGYKIEFHQILPVDLG